MSEWSLPDRPWVLHAAFEHGRTTERWIGLQAENTNRFESRLMARRAPNGAASSLRWLAPDERIDRRLAYWGAWRFRGLTSTWLAQPLRQLIS